MNVPLHGLFLAGGKSSRMGREKASLVVGNVGLTQAARGIGLLRKLCDHTYLSLREGQAAPEGAGQTPVIRDSEEAQGPLAGILGAFRETPAAAWLVMACDLPFVSEILVANLVASFRATPNAPFAAYASSRDGLPEPLCAIYGPASRSILQRHAARGHFCPRHIMREENVPLLSLPVEDTRALENLNTPEDLAEAVAAREIHLAWFGSLAERRGLR
ncbi:MAG: molybdenum cofactor guanylyltransferase, partial [Verrucomicrobia bacterium]|nr:molybdenum cofactor guanylyltransferase [Verrucomicrobiota bacterium]